MVVPGRERAGGGDQVKDSDHGHLTEVSGRACTHTDINKITHKQYLLEEWLAS